MHLRAIPIIEPQKKAKAETNMSPQELTDYYNKLRALPASTKPLVIDYVANSADIWQYGSLCLLNEKSNSDRVFW
jgi:hypothetical protein